MSGLPWVLSTAQKGMYGGVGGGMGGGMVQLFYRAPCSIPALPVSL